MWEIFAEARSRSSGCLLFAATIVSTAIGYAPPALAAEEAEQGTKLEEIIVTARRRAESVQSVPISIDVVTPQALRENNVQTIGDLQYLVPSLSASNFAT